MNAFVTETMHERITLPVKVSLSTTCAQTETGPLYRASRSAVQGIWEVFSPKLNDAESRVAPYLSDVFKGTTRKDARLDAPGPTSSCGRRGQRPGRRFIVC
jgi:hypothetical protein